MRVFILMLLLAVPASAEDDVLTIFERLKAENVSKYDSVLSRPVVVVVPGARVAPVSPLWSWQAQPVQTLYPYGSSWASPWVAPILAPVPVLPMIAPLPLSLTTSCTTWARVTSCTTY